MSAVSDPLTDKGFQRRLVNLLREIITRDPLPNRPTVPYLLLAALQDIGFWRLERGFSFEPPNEDSKRISLRVVRYGESEADYLVGEAQRQPGSRAFHVYIQDVPGWEKSDAPGASPARLR